MKIATKLLRVMSFVALVVLGPRLACSCTCEVYEDGSPKAELLYARSVFVGEVLEIRKPTADEIRQGQGLRGHLVRMKVERYWKGIKSAEISVTSDLTGCGPICQWARSIWSTRSGKTWRQFARELVN